MIGYPDWRQMWDESGPWRPTVDDMAVLLAEIDRLTDALHAVVAETEGGTFGKPQYDLTLDHLHDVAMAALEQETDG